MNVANQLYLMLTNVSEKLEQPIPLIFAYQNDGRLLKPYGTIRIDTIITPQHRVYFPVKETGYQDFGSWGRATVELQFFGINAGPAARRFALSLGSNSSVEYQTKLNVAIGNSLFLSETPQLLNQSQYEERGIYQFEFYYSEQMEDEVGLIEEVEIEGGYLPDTGPPPCKIKVRAFPPYTPEHPEQGDV